MSRTITFTDHEINMLIKALSNYYSIMGEGMDTIPLIEYDIENGLGSAMKKLYKYSRGYKSFQHYVSHRDGYKYPTYEEWIKKH